MDPLGRETTGTTLSRLGAVAIALASTAAAMEKPNVLFISIDDLRPELGCYGAEQVKTPHIDGLASQGVRFDRAYCQVPVCGASRASLLTGILPTARRFTTFRSRADQDVPNAVTLPEQFKRAGYTTISNGKIFHNHGDNAKRGWSEPPWRPEIGHAHSHDPETRRRLSAKKRGRIYELPDVADDDYHDGHVAAKTIRDLRKLKEAGKPFFLGCGFIRPHLPFYAPKRYWDLYEREKIEIADNRYRPKGAPDELRGSGEFRYYHPADFEVNSDAWHRMMRHGYLACTSYVDQLTGTVLAELDRLGLADNTIVVIWGDHGWHLGEHNFWGKHNTMHLSMRVPLIIKAPGKKAGSSSSLVEVSDVFPTLCALAGIDVPETVQGRSFASLLDDPDVAFRENAYCRFGSGDAIVTEGFTYTNYRNGKSEMLFDRKKDPDENTNVAGEPEYAETIAALRTALKQRQAEAADLTAAVPAPAVGLAPLLEVPGPEPAEVRYAETAEQVLGYWPGELDQSGPLVHGSVTATSVYGRGDLSHGAELAVGLQQRWEDVRFECGLIVRAAEDGTAARSFGFWPARPWRPAVPGSGPE